MISSQGLASETLEVLRFLKRMTIGYRQFPPLYVDDFLLFADDKKQLRQWKEAITARLADLRLTIHPGAHPKPVNEGIPFLGFVIFPGARRLKRRKGIHFQRRLRSLIAAYHRGEIPLDRVSASVKGWVNHTRYANTTGLRKSVFRANIISNGKERAVHGS